MKNNEKEGDFLNMLGLGFLVLMFALLMVNIVFINGAIILFLTVLITFMFKPPLKLLLVIIGVCSIILYFSYETVIYSWNAGIEHVLKPFGQFSSASNVFDNYSDFKGAISNVFTFNLNCLLNVPLWLYSLPIFVPLGLILANLYMVIFPTDLKDAYQKGTKKKLKNRKTKQKISKRFIAKTNKSKAFVSNSTLLGATYKNKKVLLDDIDLDKHVFVVGPTGSGKTVTICNLVESFLDRNLPVIFVDGKGDNQLSRKMLSYAQEQGSKTYHLSLDDSDSDHYDPFYVGGFTGVKDRIMTTLEWSEPFYENSANVYLQTAVKILMACEVVVSVQSIIEYLDSAKLAQLLREHEKELINFYELTAELQSLDIDKKNLQGLLYGLQAFANSEVGKKLKQEKNQTVIRFKNVIDENALAYISLRPLEFPKHARAFGKLVINDLKATLSEYINTSPCKVLIVFDEFSSFSGEEVQNLTSQGRSAGAHVVTGTQSIADLERAVDSKGAAFRNAMLENYRTWIVHSQNTVEGAEFFAKSIGTRTDYEPTVQIGEDGVTGMGSIREVQEFLVHPNDFKRLKTGEAYFKQNGSDHPPIFTKIRYSKILSES